MKPEKLSDIKKELVSLNSDQLIEICLRLTKYKKENKELLSYILFHADQPLAYAESVKESLIEDFHLLKRNSYQSAKILRKILRNIAKHAKYTASSHVELDLLLWFCKNYLLYADIRSNYKPLHTIFIRQLDKIRKLFNTLHEDLQFDYTEDYNSILREADGKLLWFQKKGFEL